MKSKFVGGWRLIFCLAVIVAGVGFLAPVLAQSPADDGVKSFEAARILAHIKTLSSNEFQGRGPGTRGEDLSIAYLEKEYREFGLEPGNPDGSYLQKVPLVGIKPDPAMELTFSGHDADASCCV